MHHNKKRSHQKEVRCSRILTTVDHVPYHFRLDLTRDYEISGEIPEYNNQVEAVQSGQDIEMTRRVLLELQ